MKISNQFMLSNSINLPTNQHSRRFNLETYSKLSENNTSSYGNYKNKLLSSNIISSPREWDFSELIKDLPRQLEEFRARQSKQKEENKATFDKIANRKVESIISDNNKPLSIFDMSGEYLTDDVKTYLSDKPFTAFRYQRLYETSPAKADLFIKNIMENGDYSEFNYDEKYNAEGYDYQTVLERVNAILTMNYNDMQDGYYLARNDMQKVFDIDDGIGERYNSLRRVNDTDYSNFTMASYEYKQLGSDEWVSSKTLDNLIPDIRYSADEKERLDAENLEKVRLHKPIGIDTESDHAIYKKKGSIRDFDNKKINNDKEVSGKINLIPYDYTVGQKYMALGAISVDVDLYRSFY